MIKWIIIGVLGLIILGYLGFDVRKAIDSPTTQSNLEYAKEVTSYVWTKYLAKPAKYLWDEIFIRLIWKPGIEYIEGRIGANKMTEMQLMATSTSKISTGTSTIKK